MNLWIDLKEIKTLLNEGIITIPLEVNEFISVQVIPRDRKEASELLSLGHGSDTLPVSRADDDGVTVRYRESPKNSPTAGEGGTGQDTSPTKVPQSPIHVICGHNFFDPPVEPPGAEFWPGDVTLESVVMEQRVGQRLGG